MDIGFVGSTGHTNYVCSELPGRGHLDVVGVAPGSAGESVEELYEQVRPFGDDATLYDDAPSLLDRGAPDLLVVACHFGDLAAVTRRALERGVHVFTEKPVATTFEGLDAVRRAHERSDAELGAMLGLRYDPAFYTARRHVRNGAVGDVRLLEARKSYKLESRGAPYPSRETYGGTIPWVGIHAVDWINWFTPGAFRSVRARHSRTGNRGHGDLEATAQVQCELADEVLATASLDYLRPEGAPTHGDDRLRVAGTEGVIEVERGRTYLTDAGATGRRDLPLDDGGSVFADFLGRVRDGTECRVSAADALYATWVCLQARRSADDRETVVLDGPPDGASWPPA